MLSRLPTLRNDDAKLLVPTTASYGKEAIKEARELQEKILYGGDPKLSGTCIICEKPSSRYGDHYVSAISAKLPRFRNNRLMATNHPMNMVACCSNAQCNNEVKKMALIASSERHRNYYNYVLAHCPTVNISLEDYMKHDVFNIEFSDARVKRLRQLKALSSRMYVEDIDA